MPEHDARLDDVGEQKHGERRDDGEAHGETGVSEGGEEGVDVCVA